MAKNVDLIAEAVALATALDAEIVTEGLNNSELSKLVSDLKVKKAEADAEAETPEALAKKAADAEKARIEAEEAKAKDASALAAVEAKAKAEAEAAKLAAEQAEAEKPPFSVAMGKSITTKRGILADGDEITAEDLTGGKTAVNAFVKSKHIDKNS